jgi:hypothetical protein
MTAKKQNLLKPESMDVCVLYDPANGRVVHVHRVATFAGAKKSSAHEIEARCLKVAKQLGHTTAHLKSLHVPHGQFKAATPYIVDVKSSKLIEQPRPARLSESVKKAK